MVRVCGKTGEAAKERERKNVSVAAVRKSNRISRETGIFIITTSPWKQPRKMIPPQETGSPTPWGVKQSLCIRPHDKCQAIHP
jgi:hypothetical protein